MFHNKKKPKPTRRKVDGTYLDTHFGLFATLYYWDWRGRYFSASTNICEQAMISRKGFGVNLELLWIMLIVEAGIVSKFWAYSSNTYETYVFRVSFFRSAPNHPPLKYRYPIKISDQVVEWVIIIFHTVFNHEEKRIG